CAYHHPAKKPWRAWDWDLAKRRRAGDSASYLLGHCESPRPNGRGRTRPWEIWSMTEHDPKPKGGPAGTAASRRDFLRGSGLAAATAVLTGPATVALDEARAAESDPKVL